MTCRSHAGCSREPPRWCSSSRSSRSRSCGRGRGSRRLRAARLARARHARAAVRPGRRRRLRARRVPGLGGTQTATANLAPTVVYVIFWVAIPFASAVLGDVFAPFNPWRAVARGASWSPGRVTGGAAAGADGLPGVARPLAGDGGGASTRHPAGVTIRDGDEWPVRPQRRLDPAAGKAASRCRQRRNMSTAKPVSCRAMPARRIARGSAVTWVTAERFFVDRDRGGREPARGPRGRGPAPARAAPAAPGGRRRRLAMRRASFGARAATRAAHSRGPGRSGQRGARPHRAGHRRGGWHRAPRAPVQARHAMNGVRAAGWLRKSSSIGCGPIAPRWLPTTG
jgi:hypothetical protein